MIGRRYWILIWYGILLLGILGLVAALHWGQRTEWRNLDEIFRAIGTILVSIGMILLLYQIGIPVGQVLLVAALVAFILAFYLGRHPTPPAAED